MQAQTSKVESAAAAAAQLRRAQARHARQTALLRVHLWVVLSEAPIQNAARFAQLANKE